MKIIYASTLCSERKYKLIFEQSRIKLGQQAQKYHKLMTEGLEKNGNEIIALTSLPITRAISKKIIFKFEKELSKNKEFRYLPFINLPGIKHIIIFINAFINVYKLGTKDRNIVLICDVLNISVSAGALIAAKLLQLNNVGIVTDVPIYLSNNRGLKVHINTWIMNSFSSYVFLTEQMNDLINKNNKPYVVIEGQVDIEMKELENILEEKYEKKVCMYTGALQKMYGIEMLVIAFLKADIEESELHIYGTGDFEEELIEICKKTDKVKYFGVKSNEYIVKEQLKATLLVNPRPTHEEYTKYSFPSKNMEYMVSGTPVLTTNLPGMPKEYLKYVYLIEKETEKELSQVLTILLNKTKRELHKQGEEAKLFAINHKNNLIQSRKIINMIEGINKYV